VHLDQPLDQIQSDPEPSLGAIEAGVDLGEHVEEARQVLGGDSDAGVLDAHDRVRILDSHRKADPPSPR
jgi:hypothetical protein